MVDAISRQKLVNADTQRQKADIHFSESSGVWFPHNSIKLATTSTHHFLGMYMSTFWPCSFCMVQALPRNLL